MPAIFASASMDHHVMVPGWMRETRADAVLLLETADAVLESGVPGTTQGLASISGPA